MRFKRASPNVHSPNNFNLEVYFQKKNLILSLSISLLFVSVSVYVYRRPTDSHNITLARQKFSALSFSLAKLSIVIIIMFIMIVTIIRCDFVFVHLVLKRNMYACIVCRMCPSVRSAFNMIHFVYTSSEHLILCNCSFASTSVQCSLSELRFAMSAVQSFHPSGIFQIDDNTFIYLCVCVCFSLLFLRKSKCQFRKFV